jgi:hypothetical protein
MTIACMRHAEMPLELISYQALCVVHRYLQNAVYRWNACSGGSGLLDRRSLRYCAQVAGSGWLTNLL